MNSPTDLLSAFEKESRRGSLTLIVLSLLQEPTHGYELLTRIEQKEIDMDTDTLYPLLRRLEDQALLIGQWDTTSTRPRKIYALTEKGKEILITMKEKWHIFYSKIERILNDE
jgi:PadR family transcriptional regulator, regulatory protein PadR